MRLGFHASVCARLSLNNQGTVLLASNTSVPFSCEQGRNYNANMSKQGSNYFDKADKGDKSVWEGAPALCSGALYLSQAQSVLPKPFLCLPDV